MVKAYPEPSKTYVETVCVAAITVPDGRWVRFYPIRFNDYAPGHKPRVADEEGGIQGVADEARVVFVPV